MQTSARRLRLPILIIVLMAVVAVLASRHTSLDWFVQNEQWLRAAIKANPVKSHIIVFFAYLIVSLVPGMAGKSIVLGWLFGLISGVLIVNIALVAAAITTFLLCRYYLQSVVQARFGPYLDPIQQRMKDDGAFYLLTLRLAHAPFSIMNYAAGAGTAVPLWTFWWTTQLGLLPGNIVFVFAGTRLPGLDVLVKRGPLSLLDGPLIAALAATVVLPWLARKLIQIMSPTRSTAQQLPDQIAGDDAEKES
ncbi:MAG: TVP38/TMEM64 family protein [Fuerstia sp.]|nr:TVP38/TMEM64 family protein [Fuerstiella sp.]